MCGKTANGFNKATLKEISHSPMFIHRKSILMTKKSHITIREPWLDRHLPSRIGGTIVRTMQELNVYDVLYLESFPRNLLKFDLRAL
jgi:hypothetical protein